MFDKVSVLMGNKVEGQKTDIVTIRITGSDRFRQVITDNIFWFVTSGDEINLDSMLGQVSISTTLAPTPDDYEEVNDDDEN